TCRSHTAATRRAPRSRCTQPGPTFPGERPSGASTTIPGWARRSAEKCCVRPRPGTVTAIRTGRRHSFSSTREPNGAQTPSPGSSIDRRASARRAPIAAGYNDGVIVVLPSSGSLPSTVQRFDGRSGQLSWEHVAVAGFLTDAAIHPDGTVYISEFHITGSTFFVSIAPDGSVTKYPLPQGRFQQVDAGTC